MDGLFPLPLPQPRARLYDILGLGPEATRAELGDAQGRHRKRLEDADPAELAEFNSQTLDNEAWKADYDARHPPCELLSIDVPWSSMFEDRAHALALLRPDVEAFLAAEGVEVYYPSDVTRRDFSGDFMDTALGGDDPTGGPS